MLGTAPGLAEVLKMENLRLSSLRPRWNLGAGLILYLWSVRPSYDLSLRLLVPFLFVGPPIAAARGRHDFVAVAVETASPLFFFYFLRFFSPTLSPFSLHPFSPSTTPL